MNDTSARLTAHIGGRIVNLSEDHSSIEAMDLSQRGDVSVGASQRSDDVDYVLGRHRLMSSSSRLSSGSLMGTSSRVGTSSRRRNGAPPSPNPHRALPLDKNVVKPRGRRTCVPVQAPNKALPRDNDIFERRGRRSSAPAKTHGGLFQKASAFIFGKKTKDPQEEFKEEFRRKTNLMGDGEFERSYSTASSWNW